MNANTLINKLCASLLISLATGKYYKFIASTKCTQRMASFQQWKSLPS